MDETFRASGSGVGLILQSPIGKLLEYAIRLIFFASNNEAEYETVLAKLDLALALAATKLEICSDSQLIVERIKKEYEANNERMARYLTLVKDRLKKLDEWKVKCIPQTENLKVDTLAGMATTLPIREAVMLPIYLQTTSSIIPESIFNTIEVDLSWMHDIVKYLQLGELPKN